jgi:pyruvate/2-oxoacid:ferredoxin oxidoreductase alpha subunit
MVITVWEVKRGMVISVKYDSGKECNILTLRTPFPIDKSDIFEELDKVVEIMNMFFVNPVPCSTSKEPVVEKKKRARVDTEGIVRKLRSEIMVGVPFNIDDIRKIIDIYKDDNNLYYHIDEMIRNGDMTRDKEDNGIFRLVDKSKSRSVSNDKAFNYRKDLYGK